MIRAIYKATNNLATAGAEGFAVMLAITLPERASEEKLKKLMDGAAQAARELEIQIAGGHTTVSKYVSEKLVTVTAFGKVTPGTESTTKGAKPGQDIVMTKWIGLEGTAILANKKREDISSGHVNNPWNHMTLT
jgi:hydrogenase maturation factor